MTRVIEIDRLGFGPRRNEEIRLLYKALKFTCSEEK